MNQDQKNAYSDAAELFQAKVFDASGSVIKEFPIWRGVKDGRYYSDENSARRNNSTHRTCDCGNEIEYGTVCQSCRADNEHRAYLKRPIKEYGDFPVCIYNDDRFFFDEDDFLEWCEDNEVEPSAVSLCDTVDNRPNTIGIDIWEDIIPENNDDPFNDEFHKKLKALNEVIKKHPPVSYSQGRHRISYSKNDPKE